MAVNLSPVGGVAAQFFDNDGNVLSGGKIYTYTAGSSTPAVTYTSAAGVIQHSNPIILDSAGRVPSGEIWLTDGIQYKFVIKNASDTLIGTYDNIIGINSNFLNYLAEQEIQTATAGQTVFTLTTTQYQPGTNTLSVFVDGVNQYGPGAQYAYTETSSTVVTFTNGLHVGAVVKFTTTQALSGGTTSSALVTYQPAGTGAVATTVQEKLRETVSSSDFGAVGDGVANDTTALINFFAACMAGKRGYLEAGTYSVDEGQIIIQPTSNVDVTGFYVETAGYFDTVIKGRGTTQAPLITIQNLTQTSGAGKFLKGGYLGDLGFNGSSQNGAWSTAHALSLRGVDGWEFGYLYGVSLKGDLLNIPQNLFGGNNPDPYHVAFCTFRGLQSNFGNGWVLNNQNFVGFTSNEVFNVACYGTISGAGAINTCGAGNIYKKISVGTCYGWAIKIYDGSTGGRASRETFSIAELDDPEYGIYIFNHDQAVFDQIRIVHRYHAGIGYWPREAVRLSDASNPTVTNTLIDITHRIEAGGVKADLGGFLRCQSSNAIEGVELVYKIVDNASFGITNADVLSGASINNIASLRLLTNIQGNRTVAFDNQSKPIAYVTLDASASIPNGGFGGAGNNIVCTGELYDRRNNFNTSTYAYTAPVTGLYRVFVSFSVTGVASGVSFKFGFRNSSSGNIIKYFTGATSSTGKHVFNGSGFVELTAGDQITLNADNSSGSAVTINTVYSLAAENSWSVELIESKR